MFWIAHLSNSLGKQNCTIFAEHKFHNGLKFTEFFNSPVYHSAKIIRVLDSASIDQLGKTELWGGESMRVHATTHFGR